MTWVHVRTPLKIHFDRQTFWLRPGRPQALPSDAAQRLLDRYPEKVQSSAAPHAHSRDQWLVAWRTLARLTTGIDRTDPRHEPVLTALAVCDRYFECDRWDAFIEAARVVQEQMEIPLVGDTDGE